MHWQVFPNCNKVLNHIFIKLLYQLFFHINVTFVNGKSTFDWRTNNRLLIDFIELISQPMIQFEAYSYNNIILIFLLQTNFTKFNTGWKAALKQNVSFADGRRRGVVTKPLYVHKYLHLIFAISFDISFVLTTSSCLWLMFDSSRESFVVPRNVKKVDEKNQHGPNLKIQNSK